MITDFIDQCQTPELSEEEREELIAGEQSCNLNGGDL